MDGDELGRRLRRLRADSRAWSRLALLWRASAGTSGESAMHCVRAVRQPLRRLEPLRRRLGLFAPLPTAGPPRGRHEG
ncbi:hypothetical protein [Crenalkalicoccus roseus]|uniref:hypothetical protein n=1 Tax=Crenalkalicoccus roseus TaxID=1485588 RepID=UPI0010805AD3|nr:hypothetical protein [Crenalkalicoccus roseus]